MELQNNAQGATSSSAGLRHVIRATLVSTPASSLCMSSSEGERKNGTLLARLRDSRDVERSSRMLEDLLPMPLLALPPLLLRL